VGVQTGFDRQKTRFDVVKRTFAGVRNGFDGV